MIFDAIISIIVFVLIILLVVAMNGINKLETLLNKKNEELNDRIESLEMQNTKKIEELKRVVAALSKNTDIKLEETKSIITEVDNNRKNDKYYVDRTLSQLTEGIHNNNDEIDGLKEKVTSDETIIHELNELIVENQEKQDKIIKEINEEIDKNKDSLADIIANLSASLNSLRIEQLDLKKKVEFFAGMAEDSTKLNDISMTKEGIEKEANIINQAIQQLKEKKKLKEEPHSEQSISSIELTAKPDLSSETAKIQKIDFEMVADKTIEEPETRNEPVEEESVIEGFTGLDEYQEKAYSIMNDTNDNLFITGRAGTGKSLLLSVFSQATDKKILKLAPTGIAALNIGGATVHSTFGYSNLVGTDCDDLSSTTLILNTEKRLVLKNVETIIIDEVSMLRVDVVEKIDKILRIINNTNTIFGGKQMVFVGDPFQLPPVTKGKEEQYLNDKYGGVYFYDSPAYQEADFKFVELNINHRQNSDPKFYDILNHIREGKFREEDLASLNKRVIDEEDSSIDRVIRLFATKVEVEKVNNKCLEKIYGKEYDYKATIEYSKYKNQTYNIDANFPFPETLRLKVGANVMFVNNDVGNKKWVNGQIGVVKSLDDNVVEVLLNNEVVNVEKAVFSEQEAKYQNGKIIYDDLLKVRQFPLTLAYAITIHKSQGMTYPQIVCDISNCFQHGQEYVALSRTISLDGLHLLSPIKTEDVSVDKKTVDFYWNCLLSNEDQY